MKLAISRKRFVLALGAVGLLVSSLAFAFKPTRFHSNAANNRVKMPPVVLWAWERPSDLSFVNPKEVGVAFLSRTITLRGTRFLVRPRLQSLKVPEGTVLTAVARIETDRSNPLALSETQRRELVSSLREMATAPGIVAVQLDFDAKQSERAFYRQLITELRRELPAEVGLSITALGSWCVGDKWLEDLPIDDAVPMLFQMGADASQILARLRTKEDFPEVKCRNSYGIATDEPIEGLQDGKRVYAFSQQGWTRESVKTLLEQSNHAQ